MPHMELRWSHSSALGEKPPLPPAPRAAAALAGTAGEGSEAIPTAGVLSDRAPADGSLSPRTTPVGTSPQRVLLGVRFPYFPPLLAVMEQQLSRGLPPSWWLTLPSATDPDPAGHIATALRVTIDLQALQEAEEQLRARLQAQLLCVRADHPGSWRVLVCLIEEWVLANELLRRDEQGVNAPTDGAHDVRSDDAKPDAPPAASTAMPSTEEGRRVLWLELEASESHWRNELAPLLDQTTTICSGERVGSVRGRGSQMDGWLVHLRVLFTDRHCMECDP